MSTVSIESTPKSKRGAAKSIVGDAKTSARRKPKPELVGAKTPTQTQELLSMPELPSRNWS